MSKYGTYKVVEGKVVQVTEAEKYEPKAIVVKPCRCAVCLLNAFAAATAEAESAAQVVSEPKVYTGQYL